MLLIMSRNALRAAGSDTSIPKSGMCCAAFAPNCASSKTRSGIAAAPRAKIPAPTEATTGAANPVISPARHHSSPSSHPPASHGLSPVSRPSLTSSPSAGLKKEPAATNDPQSPCVRPHQKLLHFDGAVVVAVVVVRTRGVRGPHRSRWRRAASAPARPGAVVSGGRVHPAVVARGLCRRAPGCVVLAPGVEQMSRWVEFLDGITIDEGVIVLAQRIGLEAVVGARWPLLEVIGFEEAVLPRVVGAVAELVFTGGAVAAIVLVQEVIDGAPDLAGIACRRVEDGAANRGRTAAGRSASCRCSTSRWRGRPWDRRSDTPSSSSARP